MTPGPVPRERRSFGEGSQDVSYEQLLLTAAECVAAAYQALETEEVMDLCLAAGKLRGLCCALAPTNGRAVSDTVRDANHLLQRMDHSDA